MSCYSLDAARQRVITEMLHNFDLFLLRISSPGLCLTYGTPLVNQPDSTDLDVKVGSDIELSVVMLTRVFKSREKEYDRQITYWILPTYEENQPSQLPVSNMKSGSKCEILQILFINISSAPRHGEYMKE